MGEEVRYHCPECGRDHFLSIGWFFRSPATAEAVLSGEYGEKAKRNFERHPGRSAMFSHDVFRCSCGYARSKQVMVIFGDDRAPWDMGHERNVVWHNARCRCPRCGRRMKAMDDLPRRIRCTCGKWTDPSEIICLFD